MLALVVRSAVVYQPACDMPSLRVVVRPVNNTAFFVIFLMAGGDDRFRRLLPDFCAIDSAGSKVTSSANSRSFVSCFIDILEVVWTVDD
jgi:hypothetical protein